VIRKVRVKFWLQVLPAVTLTLGSSGGPAIEPLPFTSHAYVAIPAGARYLLPLEDGQNCARPLMGQAGKGLIVTACAAVLVHPPVAPAGEAVTVRVYEPAEPAST